MGKCICILGMHRSGTSLLAKILAASGVKFGNVLNAQMPDNPNGYWEHVDIMYAQEDLMNYFKLGWHDENVLEALPPNWLQDEFTISVKSHLKSIVETEISKYKLWAFKDPRSLRFIPLWFEIFTELKIKPIYIYAIRSPAESIASLVQRDAISEDLAEKLWVLNNLEIQQFDLSLCVINYNAWFDEPALNARKLGKLLGINPGVALSQVDGNLKHQLSTKLYPTAQKMYDAIVKFEDV